MMAELTSDLDAYRAALGSLLAIELDQIPAFEGVAAPLQWDAWIATELNLAVLRMSPNVLPIPVGYWLGRLPSPYPGYDLHSVVMRGTALAHDPHPEPQQYPIELSICEVFVPLDPAEPSGRWLLYG